MPKVGIKLSYILLPESLVLTQWNQNWDVGGPVASALFSRLSKNIAN